MGRGPWRPEGETPLKEAGRGWRGRGHPPAEGFSSWIKDRGGEDQRQLQGPGAPAHLHFQRRMASSHLLGAGVSDSLGVPSVSLLSEDAVASESVSGEGWSEGGWGAPAYSPEVQCQFYGWAPGNLTPQLAHTCSSGEAHSFLKQPFTTDFLPGLYLVTCLSST